MFPYPRAFGAPPLTKRGLSSRWRKGYFIEKSGESVVPAAGRLLVIMGGTVL
jgi:hypothetical protein